LVTVTPEYTLNGIAIADYVPVSQYVDPPITGLEYTTGPGAAVASVNAAGGV
jgi:hypothetical protein